MIAPRARRAPLLWWRWCVLVAAAALLSFPCASTSEVKADDASRGTSWAGLRDGVAFPLDMTATLQSRVLHARSLLLNMHEKLDIVRSAAVVRDTAVC
jgi:hypothetical protein